MSIFRRISAFLLLAVWLTSTQHCGLEAAGLWDLKSDRTASPICSSAKQQASHDDCEALERGPLVTANTSVKVPAPSMQVCTFLLFVELVAPVIRTEPSIEFADGIDRPLRWALTWHFERRAALSPRAPSLVLA